MARSLAIAMIVKDESAHLAGCLDSARAIADEICILDTGSRDDTVAIARRFDAQVGLFTWCDDFAAARNESLRLCSADWIFMLDADERLARADVPKIRTLADGPLACCYRMLTRNYTNAEGVSEFRPNRRGSPHAHGFAGWFPSWKVRMFPNHPGARYEGKVHELIRGSLEEHGIRVVQSDVVIYHYPFLRDGHRIREKERLYLRLGLEKAQAHPEDPNAHAELGHQYADLGDYTTAVAAYRESLKHGPRNAAVLKDLGGMLHLIHRDAEAKKSLQLAIECDPGLAEAWRNLGVIHAGQEEWAASVDCFARAVSLDPHWADGPRYLSVALDKAGRLADAAQAARRAVEASPDSVAASDLYVNQMVRLGRSAEARAVLEHLESADDAGRALSRALSKLASFDSTRD